MRQFQKRNQNEPRKQYHKPEITAQGSVVTRTRATPDHECYDGNPEDPLDNQKSCC
jgi:hypothetical protein